ncbi:MAG TPA: hypothetical protein PKE69_03800 [Pyrinomonadaceae bacterium]|nr:hypothetical protein [Pyrinomonadaceae bacterium]
MNRINFIACRLFVALFFLGTFFAATGSAQNTPKLPAGMKGSNADDPRSKLKSGLFDAEENAMGMKHVFLFKKPEAFQLGTNDADNPRVQNTLKQLGVGDTSQFPKAFQIVFAQLAFSNSDLAFQGNYLFQGNFYGMNIYDISKPAETKLLTSMVCPGGQGDVSVYKNLMFMSVEMPNGRLDCGIQGFEPIPIPTDGTEPKPDVQKERFRGVRIFDISDIRKPKQVGAVQTCRGSHTHTLVTDPKDKNNVYIYNSGTSFVRPGEELAGCSDGSPDKNPKTSLFSIDIIKVPVAKPQDSKIVSSPRIFMDSRTGVINSLNDGGSHDSGGRVQETDQCHDITVYSEIGLAAGACSGNGIILDIKDPANPKRVDAVNDPNYAYWHSAAFSNDGKKVVFTDEWGGGLGARCRENDPNVWGANAIFNLENNKLNFASYYKLPAAQGETENCVAHNGSLVPVPGRDIKVQAWYQGGISIMDFTDAKNPMEIAYFDRGAVDPKMLMMGGSWSAYWFNGNIYSSEIARGLDVFELSPSKYLTQNEIDAAKSVQVGEFNVQNQQKIVYSNKLIVAKAYLDQLERSNSLSAEQITSLRDAIAKAESSNMNKKDVKKLKGFATSLNKTAGTTTNSVNANRMRMLAGILKKPVA